MSGRIRLSRTFSQVVGVSVIAFAAVSSGYVPALAANDLVTKLQNGGYVIYVRHASTEKDYADQVSAEIGNCSTQRTLSAKGWQEAKQMGAAMAMLKIPVGEVYSSQYCRAWQTAELAFGSPKQLESLNFEPAEDFSTEQIEAMKGRVQPLLTQKPSEGFNTIIVGHDDPFEAATGIYPEPQGVAYILKPDSTTESGFVVEGFIKPETWPNLLGS